MRPIVSARDSIFKLSTKPEGYDEAKAAAEEEGRREKVMGAFGGAQNLAGQVSKRLALLGPEWKYKRDKNGLAYMAQRSGVGEDGKPITHLATVGDPLSDEVTIDHTALRPTGFVTTRKSADAMHEPDWETSTGERIPSPRDISWGAKHRGEVLKRIQQNPQDFREVPPMLSGRAGRLPRQTQWDSLSNSLTPEGLKTFDSGSLHGEPGYYGHGRGGASTYQWRHFATPIAYVERYPDEPGKGSSVVITAAGRDYSGASGWANSTSRLIHSLKSDAEHQGYHVKYDDDWAPPQEDVDKFSAAGWDRDPESGDFTYTTLGRRGNPVHLRATAIHNPGYQGGYRYDRRVTPRYNLETYRGLGPKDAGSAGGLIPVNLNRHKNLNSVFTNPEDLINEAQGHISKFGEVSYETNYPG